MSGETFDPEGEAFFPEDAEQSGRFDLSSPRSAAENFAGDYLELPEIGAHHYNLRDAALAIAIDAWDDDRARHLTSPEINDLDDYDEPEVRKALVPLVETYLEVLIESFEAGQLEAIVRARSWPARRADPARTYVDLRDLRDWLELHQQPVGDFLHMLADDNGEEYWAIAQDVAESRARFRTPVKLPAVPANFDGDGAYRALLKELEDARRRIAILEGSAGRATGNRHGSGRERELSTHPRRTLLAIIAALCKKVGIDPKARGAATAIALITEDAGLRVSDDTIRGLLGDMADAIENRSSPGKPNSGK